MIDLWRLAAAAALVLLLAGPAGADEAVVVGLDRYPTLRPEAALSGGVNDARLMATSTKVAIIPPWTLLPAEEYFGPGQILIPVIPSPMYNVCIPIVLDTGWRSR